MKLFPKCLIILAYCFSTHAFSQIVEGSVVDDQGNTIENATLSFSSKKNPHFVKEFVVVDTGIFQYRLKNSYEDLVIKIHSLGYKTDSIIVENVIKKVYTINIELKESITPLKEVVLDVEKRAFSVQKDTISYRVAAFTDGTERKIEDVIKNLPGIEVDERTGEIKYKGKSIETVTLEGDNLFGYNYSLGTKNINVDLVEEVEAIDNYSENPLLKGIEKEGKVALNLKLKDEITDFSTDLDLSTGIFTNSKWANSLNSTILGISKRSKSFGTFNYNNIGENNSQLDHFGFGNNIEQIKEKEYLAEKIIPEARFSSSLDDNRVRKNNQFFGNYNNIATLSKRLTFRSNFFALKDEISNYQLNVNEFLIDNQRIETSDETFLTKKPRYFRADFQLKYNSSPSSLIEYNLSLRNEDIRTKSNIIQNRSENLQSTLKSTDFFLKQNFLLTKKTGENDAFQIIITQAYNNLPQFLQIDSPSIEATEMVRQESGFSKIYFNSKTAWIGSNEGKKYNLSIGVLFDQSSYESSLNNLPNASHPLFNSENKLQYKKRSLYSSGSYSLKFQKWRFSSSFKLSYLNQIMEQGSLKQKEGLLFEPNLNIKYSINSSSFLSSRIGYDITPTSEEFLFSNDVLISHRSVIRNIPSLEFSNSRNFSLYYYNNDLYNHFQLNILLTYRKLVGNIFRKMTINEEITHYEYFFLPQKNNNWLVNLKTSKYFPGILSTIELKSNFSSSTYQNIINNSNLRNNKNLFLKKELKWKSAFDLPINFENGIYWIFLYSKSKEEMAFVNYSIGNNFKAIFNLEKKWYFVLSSDYYLPEVESDADFHFLDGIIKYKPVSKNWEASLTLKNLLDTKNFEQVQNTDVSSSIYRSSLLPGYFLLNIIWNL